MGNILQDTIRTRAKKLAVTFCVCLLSACGYDAAPPEVESGTFQSSYAAGTHGAGTLCSELSGSIEIPLENVNCEVVNEPPVANSTACVDGVCCDSKCDAVCEACDMAGDTPEDDGAGYCKYIGGTGIGEGIEDAWPRFGPACGRDARCENGNRVSNSLCRGANGCVGGEIQDCGFYACVEAFENDGAPVPYCNTECSQDSECATDAWCYTPESVCTNLAQVGAVCSNAAQCASHACVDGICCATPCEDTCKSCNQAYTGAVNGECAVVDSGEDPGNDCADAGAPSCQLTGACDGSGSCQFYANGTVCSPAVCAAGDAQGNSTCISQACIAPTAVECALYACENAVCNDSCVDDTDCATGARCYNGACSDLNLDGEVCTQGGQCASTHCVDGVCCDTACDSLCESCLQASSGFATGTCGNVEDGLDPRSVCSDQGEPSCGQDGVCDGNGACRLYSNGVICAPEICSGGDRLPESACLNQSCTPPPTVDCGHYACVDATCNTSCTQDNDCNMADDGWCYTPLSMCSNLRHNGDACTANAQCASNYCVDGVCCDSGCAGSCESCVEAYTNSTSGECHAVVGGQDPGNDCATEGVQTCGQNGYCDGARGCQAYPNETVCGSAVCLNGDSRDVSTCQTGACVAPATVDCGHYACRTAACLESCANNGDCNWQESAYCYVSSEMCTDLSADGTACTSGAECASGFCTDGVCCESACTSTCKACILSATDWGDGNCRNVKEGRDPRSVCSDQGEASCGTDGVCDGSGGCRAYANGTVCAGPQCSGTNVYGDSSCSGGACTLPAVDDCGLYSCTNDACRTDCSTDSHCDEASGAWCNDGVCTDKKHPGEACGAHSECGDNYCVGGVCCDGPCTGGCSSCNGAYTGLAAGVCGAVHNQTDPQNACEDAGEATCGNTGLCNNSGACDTYANGTVCANGVCLNGDWRGNSLCGSGACTAPSTQDCALYACSSSGCLTSCTTDGHCAAGAWCFGGACTDKNHQGDACTQNGECASNSCVDGVCCNSGCSSTCQSCVHAQTNLSDGTCGFIVAGSDPAGECSDEGESTCGQNGFCNGLGACDSYADNTVCGLDYCSGANLINGGVCATGTCTAGAVTDCGAYGCNSGSCRTSCSENSHCDTGSGYWCYDGSCTNKSGNASVCSSNGQCASGFCVDGICCSAACDAGCVACKQTYTGVANGTCANVSSGTDPYNSCTDGGEASCGFNGACNGGACASYADGTGCSAAYCSGDNLVTAGSCSSGSCSGSSTQDCGAYTCRNSACLTTCASNNDCDDGNGYWCNGTSCTNLKPQGETCANNNQCASGNCVDGYCCNSSCTGSCQSCSNASTGWGNGTCAYVYSGHDPRSDCTDGGVAACGQDGTCDGSGGCRAYAAGTVCADNCCSGGDEQPDSYCNNGSCHTPSSLDCGDYICDGCACRNSCTSDTHCAGSARCTNNACALNQGPTAVSLWYETMNEDSSFSGSVSATDPEGDNLDFLLYGQPSYGSVSNWDENNGSFQYTPNGNYCGYDWFYFRVFDGEFYSAWGYHAFYVTCLNDAPTIGGIGNQSMDWAAGTKRINLSIGDVDTALSSMTVTGDSNNDGLIADSSVTATLDGGTWRLDISAQAAVGSATITVYVNDNAGGSAQTSFNMNVTGAAQCECECAGIIDFYGICIGCWNWPPWQCQNQVPSDCYDYSNSVDCDG